MTDEPATAPRRIKLRSSEGLAWLRSQGTQRTRAPDYRATARAKEEVLARAAGRTQQLDGGSPLADAIDVLYPVGTLERDVIQREAPKASMEDRIRGLLLVQAQRRAAAEPYRPVRITARAMRTISLGRGALPCYWSDGSLVRWAT